MRGVTLLILVGLGGCVEERNPLADGDATQAPDAEIELDAAMPDGAPEADAMVAEVDAAPAPDPCPAVCARFVDCAVEICPEADAGDGAEIAGWCAAGCAANGSFAAVAAGTETCEDLVAFGRQTLDEAFAARCVFDPGDPPAVAACARFGPHLVECLGRSCPGVLQIEETAAAAYVHLCEEAVASGGFSEAQAEALAAAACDSPALANVLQNQLDGAVGLICERGPLTDPALCEAACAVVGPCIPIESDSAALRDPARCALFCATSAAQRTTRWECARDAESCEDSLACFSQPEGPPPEIPECAPWAERITECMLGQCPAVAPVAAGLVTLMHDQCDAQIASGVPVERLDGVGAAACDDPRFAAFLAHFLEDDPQVQGDGILAPLCRGDEWVALETCRAGCEGLAPCAAGDPAEDPDVCLYICATRRDVDPALWACFAEEAGRCEAVLACLP